MSDFLRVFLNARSLKAITRELTALFHLRVGEYFHAAK